MLLPDGVVVVSPHLDDGILSLGSTIAATRRAGRRVTLVTVFAGVPDSTREAGKWDRRGGFTTEGEASRTRRGEDQRACAIVGAEPIWLENSEADYRDGLDEESIWALLLHVLEDAPASLFPGFPLTNPDHAWVAALLGRRAALGGRVGLYAEQPYRFWRRHEQLLPEVVGDSGIATIGRLEWQRSRASISCLRIKRKALRAYRSQLPLLGLDRGFPSRLDRLLAYEVLERGEAVAWVTAS